MIESVAARKGKNPITGADLSPPQNPLGNPINGNELTAADELQYACIFDLPKELERDCTISSWPSCDCSEQPSSVQIVLDLARASRLLSAVEVVRRG